MNDKKQGQISQGIKIAIEIGIILFAVAIAWATLRGDVQDNTEDIEKHDGRIVSVEKEAADVKADIREIKTDQKHIIKGIDEIKKKL